MALLGQSGDSLLSMAPPHHVELTKIQKLLKSKSKKQNENEKQKLSFLFQIITVSFHINFV